MSVTRGIYLLPNATGLIWAIKQYDTFTEDSDSYQEHDFGSLVWDEQKVLWKIDYYDSLFEHWCDPLSLEYERVLTIMLAEEYLASRFS